MYADPKIRQISVRLPHNTTTAERIRRSRSSVTGSRKEASVVASDASESISSVSAVAVEQNTSEDRNFLASTRRRLSQKSLPIIDGSQHSFDSSWVPSDCSSYHDKNNEDNEYSDDESELSERFSIFSKSSINFSSKSSRRVILIMEIFLLGYGIVILQNSNSDIFLIQNKTASFRENKSPLDSSQYSEDSTLIDVKQLLSNKVSGNKTKTNNVNGDTSNNEQRTIVQMNHHPELIITL